MGKDKFQKLSVQVPPLVRELFVDLDHGHKQLAVTGGLLWYFNSDEDTQRLYRAWASGIAEGFATIEEPPPEVVGALKELAKKTRSRPKPRKPKRQK